MAWIGLRSELNRIILSYRHRENGGAWHDIDYGVAIEEVACTLGGKRPYFSCPGVVNGRPCGRRVIKLYAAGRYFLCRHCYGLTYASQSEGEWDRALRRADKARRRLGGGLRSEMSLPGRPKGMWQRTYQRRCNELIEAEDAADEMFVAVAQRLLARSGRQVTEREC